MNKQTIQAAGFGKKAYAKPEMKAYQVKPASIICGSGPKSTSSNEEYEEVSTSTWF